MSDLVFYLVSNVQPKGKYRLRFPKADPTQITVAKMRQQVRQITGIPEREQILRYKGAILTDNETAASLGLVNEDTILLEAPSGTANPNTAVAATPPPAQPPPPQPVAQPPPRGPPPRGPPPQQPPPRPVYQPAPVGAAPAPFPPSPVRPLAPPPPPPMFRGPPPPPPPAPIPDGRPWDPVPLYGGGGGPAPGPGPAGPLPQSTPIPLETARPLPPPRKGSPTRPPVQAMPPPPPPPPPIQPAQMMPPPAPLQGSPFLDQVPDDCADAAMLWPLMEQILDRKRQNSAMKREQEAVREARRLAYIQEHKDLIELKFKYEMEASRLREEIEDKKLALERAGRNAQQVQQSIERLEVSRQQDEQALAEQEQTLDTEINVLDDQAHQLREKELACIRRQMWVKSEEQRKLKEERLMLLGERKVRQGGLDTQDRVLQQKIAEITRLEAALQRDWDDIERRRVALEEEKGPDDSNQSRVLSVAQVDHTIRNKERPRSRSANSVATTVRPVPPRAADIASREQQRLEDRERDRDREQRDRELRERERERERGDRRVVVEEYHSQKRTAVTPGRYREQRSDSPASQLPPRGAVTPGARRSSETEFYRERLERGDRDDRDYDSRRGTSTERDNISMARSPLRPMPVRGGDSREGSPRRGAEREIEYYQRTSRSGSPTREYGHGNGNGDDEDRYGYGYGSRAPPAATSPAARGRTGSPVRPYNRP